MERFLLPNKSQQGNGFSPQGRAGMGRSTRDNPVRGSDRGNPNGPVDLAWENSSFKARNFRPESINRICHRKPEELVVMLNAGPNRSYNRDAAIALSCDLKSYTPNSNVTLVVRIDDKELADAGLTTDRVREFPEFVSIAEKLADKNVAVRPLVQKLCNSELEARAAISGQYGMPPFTHLICISHSSALARRLNFGITDGLRDAPGAKEKAYSIMVHPEEIPWKQKLSEYLSLGISFVLRNFKDDAVRDLYAQEGTLGKVYRFVQDVKINLFRKHQI